LVKTIVGIAVENQESVNVRGTLHVHSIGYSK